MKKKITCSQAPSSSRGWVLFNPMASIFTLRRMFYLTDVADLFFTVCLSLSALGSDVRPSLVRSRRPRWLGHLPPRGRLHLRSGHLGDIQPLQRADPGVQGPPAGHGGLQLVPRPQRGHHLLGAQLLLQVREPSRNHGAGRRAEILIVSIYTWWNIKYRFIYFYLFFFFCETSVSPQKDIMTIFSPQIIGEIIFRYLGSLRRFLLHLR